MSNIYQEIWDADQSESGITPVLDTTDTSALTQGFVKVNSQLNSENQNLRVLPEVVIPDHKKHTYDLCRALFNNYALPERDEDLDTPHEREEIHNMVHAMVDSAPMLVARDYVAKQTGTSISRERWYNTLMDHWFRRFQQSGDPHLSGFEHVVVGEQEGSKAQGYHFWYKYYLDDGFAHQVDGSRENFPGLQSDRIAYLGSRQTGHQAQYPESVTISYRWHAPDYDRKAVRPLTKKIGGFFVGCSVEGLLALGSVRAHLGAQAPKEAVINGAKYKLKVFRNQDNRHIRTFYPVFTGAADPQIPPVTPPPPTQARAKIRIIAALINPEGHDPGHETVTLINIGIGTQSLDGWRLVDRNGKQQLLGNSLLQPGEVIRITLPLNSVQLSNKGGKISLFNAQDQLVHSVSYSKSQARSSGETVLF